MTGPNKLFWILLRPTLPSTLKVAVVSFVFILFNTEVMTPRTLGIWFLWPLVHVALISWRRSPHQRARLAFFLTSGFTPIQLWRNMLLAQLTAALIAWLPIALLIGTGMRGLFQAEVMANPDFPLMAPLEYPILALAGINYLVFVGLGIFNLAQPYQPHAGRGNSKWLIAAILLTLLTIENLIPGRPYWLNHVAIAAAAAVTLLTLAHARTLFQTMEVA